MGLKYGIIPFCGDKIWDQLVNFHPPKTKTCIRLDLLAHLQLNSSDKTLGELLRQVDWHELWLRDHRCQFKKKKTMERILKLLKEGKSSGVVAKDACSQSAVSKIWTKYKHLGKAYWYTKEDLKTSETLKQDILKTENAQQKKKMSATCFVNYKTKQVDEHPPRLVIASFFIFIFCQGWYREIQVHGLCAGGPFVCGWSGPGGGEGRINTTRATKGGGRMLNNKKRREEEHLGGTCAPRPADLLHEGAALTFAWANWSENLFSAFALSQCQSYCHDTKTQAPYLSTHTV